MAGMTAREPTVESTADKDKPGIFPVPSEVMGTEWSPPYGLAKLELARRL